MPLPLIVVAAGALVKAAAVTPVGQALITTGITEAGKKIAEEIDRK